MVRRLFRKAVQQGRSKRRGESYSLPYVEPLSAARTPLADFVNRLLAERLDHSVGRVEPHCPYGWGSGAGQERRDGRGFIRLIWSV